MRRVGVGITKGPKQPTSALSESVLAQKCTDLITLLSTHTVSQHDFVWSVPFLDLPSTSNIPGRG